MSICLLLCGDIHPCPGPAGDSDNFNKCKAFSKRGLHFIHINVRSLLPKLDEVRIISRQTKAACICITETWLDDTVPDAEIFIDNYIVQRNDRNRQGDGVLIYVRKDFAFNSRCDLQHEELEATWLEVLLPKSKPILCGVIYRPPHQTNFYSILDSVCSSTSHFSEYETILLGDFNTDVSKTSKSCSLYSSFSSFIDMFNYTQLIHDFTRICSTSSTTIDLILVSDSNNISQSGVIETSFSDHYYKYLSCV